MRFKVSINKRDVLASGLLCLLGLAAVLQVSASSVSKISGMGAGVLPVVFGSLLMFVGILWLFDSRLSPDEEEGIDIGVSKWRGSCGVVSGVFAFLLLSKYGGMLPAVFALIFVTVLGDRRHSWRSALLLASGSTLLAALALAYSPGLAFSMFRWG
ncbi:tripartite tricarboxylate transporter TctB family protein [Achromobacter sp. F4_2707]|uniref:tripartite tricarboxylate transporter TctB family protein n=1 Tax=Achromobacter sp. F4_2707 TaxID=3114286 RepID=UPI0039C6FC49